MTVVAPVLPPSAASARSLSAIRILTGLIWLSHGVPKLLNPQWAAPNGMMGSFVGKMTEGQSGFYHDFLTRVVVPHASLFAHLVAWGETLVGVSLVLGLLTRLGAAVGVFLPLNYWLAKGLGQVMGPASLDATTLVLTLVSLLLPTGRVWGVDAIIGRSARSLT